MQTRLAHLDTEALAISHIYAKSWQAAYRGIVPDDYLLSLRGDEWATRITDPHRTVIVLANGNTLVGVATVGAGRDSEWPNCGELMSIYLLPEVMHRGYGRRLLADAEARLSQQGHQTIYLWVLAANANGRRFYEKHGYGQTQDVKTLTIMGKSLATIRYVKQL